MKKTPTTSRQRKKAADALAIKSGSPYSTQTEAMKWLQKHHPDFFNDPAVREVAAVVVLILADELRPLSPLRRTSIIAGTISLMYQMGTAALKSISDPKKRKMGRILADGFKLD